MDGDNSNNISNHSISMTLMEPCDSVVLHRHNCNIEIGAVYTISYFIITCHNNKLYSKASSNNSGTGSY
jgi:hypothetical protein